MNIEYLREFTEAAMALNLSKAARTLHLSQPSLSKHISALEKECGAKLFERSSSRLQLTPAGRVLFEEAHKLLRFHDETLEKIWQMRSAETIRMGGLFRSRRILDLTNAAVAQLNETAAATVEYQDHRFQPHEKLLRDRKIDVAITILSPGDQIAAGLEAVHLFDDPMVCLIKRQHPYAERKQLSIPDLSGQGILQPVGSYSTEHGRSTVKWLLDKYGAIPLQHPVFIHSISELSTVPNQDNLLIMESSMAHSQPFGDEYRIVPFAETDAVFRFHALVRKNEANETVRNLAKHMANLSQQETA